VGALAKNERCCLGSVRFHPAQTKMEYRGKAGQGRPWITEEKKKTEARSDGGHDDGREGEQ